MHDSLNGSNNSSIFEGSKHQRRAKIDPIISDIKALAMNEGTTFIKILSIIVKRYSNTNTDFDSGKMKTILNAIIDVDLGKNISEKKRLSNNILLNSN